MLIIRNNRKIFLFVFIIFIAISISIFCEKNNKSTNIKNVDIYNVVKEAFLTDKGYTGELSKHMSERVFKTTNIYNIYNVDSSNYKKLFKVDFSLKEDSQNKVNDIVYVKMIYSVNITDSQNKIIGGARDVPMTFTVENIKDEWYITEKYEPA